MSTLSSFAGDGGDTLGLLRSRSAVAAAEEKSEVSLIKEEEAAAATRDWSSLPKPAILLILMGLRPSIRDAFSFPVVCKAWLSVFTDCKGKYFSSLPPLLVDCNDFRKALGCFNNFFERRIYRRKQPIPRRWDWGRPTGSPHPLRWFVIGIFHGYLIISPLRHPVQIIFLLDPLFPESPIELPPASDFSLDKFRRALMTAPPTSPDCVVVLTEKYCIWYCRPGDTEWARHDLRDGFDAAPSDAVDEWMIFGLCHVAVLGRRLYSLASFRKLLVVELLFPRPSVAVMDVEGLPLPSDYDALDQLVASDGDILYIAKKNTGGGGGYCCEHKYIVRRLDLLARRWVTLDTLGKRSIFLPRYCKWETWRGTPFTCVGAAEWGGREDCIYSQCDVSGIPTMWSMKGGIVEHLTSPKEFYFSEWFNPVVGGGTNGSVIHYSRNDQNIREGDLVLMDVGCEFHGYLSDLTRTWPPCGSFSSVQEALYDLILETNKECVKLCRPGVSIQQIHNSSVRMLCKGLKELGILKDDRTASTYYQLNPTSIGHYLGMDVHDCSTVSNSRPLQPGVVITIEPGVYIPLSADVPERYRGIGIRIEDEVLITDTGYEVLTGSMPKEISHLKSLHDYAKDDLRAASS